MFHAGNYFLNFYAFPPLLTGIAVGALGAWVFAQERRSSASFAFLLMSLGAMMWQLSYAGLFSCSIRTVALEWVRLEIFFVAWIPALVLLFSLAVTGQISNFRWFLVSSICLSAWFTFEIFLGTRFVEGVYEYWWGYYARFAPTSKAFLTYFGSALVLSLAFLVSGALREESLIRRKRLRALVWALLVGYVGVVDYLPVFGLNVYPFGYAAVLGFVLLSALAIRRYHLVDLTPEFAAKDILNAMTDGLLVLDDRGVARVANPAACRLLGSHPLSGKRLSDIAPYLVSDARLRESEKGNETYDVTVPGGLSAVVWNVSLSPVLGRQGSVLGHVCIVRDVSAHKKAIETLIEKKIELARGASERDQLKLFAMAASHDLREPLNKIISFGDLLEGAVDTDPAKARLYAERMKTAARRMLGLLEALMRLSRVSSEEPPLEYVDLREAVVDAVSDLQARIDEAGAAVEVGKLPVVRADRAQMYELFQNLVSNAIKFRRPGVPPQVSISTEDVNGVTRIRVADNGIGFPSDKAERIFRPFQRLHSRAEYEGHGLGLAICEQIVKRHGGRIHAESGTDSGAAFIVELPAGEGVAPR